jgi:hypothetical protein
MSAMDAEFTKWLVTLGVGGILAAFMFTFYRKDVKQYTELWRTTAEQLVNVVKENTASNTKLITMLESLERNVLRKHDIETMIDMRISERNRDYGRNHTDQAQKKS